MRLSAESQRSINDAQTLNPRGTTVVPLEANTLGNGEVCIRAKDPAYAAAGPDEAQKFQPSHD